MLGVKGRAPVPLLRAKFLSAWILPERPRVTVKGPLLRAKACLGAGR